MSILWRPFQQSRTVPCTLAVEQTRDNLFAHVELDGVDVGPGDEVLIHDAPEEIIYGARFQCRRLATVRRASLAERIWTHLIAPLGLGALYEVGFLARRQR